ncbi:uncharacterized protein LOC129238838 [Anastrepha obliqua]|uniref:uncharacterized protein LOC129238838 n=1 Tax=Anastrepha obliqua TaxID=95512 RepID=UPI00240A12DF|nr:uncharacterized protein LOC129238838 [Anastrepha obliqua]
MQFFDTTALLCIHLGGSIVSFKNTADAIKMDVTVKKLAICSFAELFSENQSSSDLLIAKKMRKRHKLIFHLWKTQRIARNIPKCKKFLECIEEMPNDVFYSHFRMQIQTFQTLCEIVQPFWPAKNAGRPNMPLKLALHITLWRLGNQNSFRELSNIFNVGIGATYRVFFKTIKILLKLKSRIIKFPLTASERRIVMEKFQAMRSNPFPFVLGCVDGTHIKITQPTQSSISFYNRKGTFSVIAQAVVDSELRFIDVFAGYPGRCHDASVWQSSPLRQAIINGDIPFPPECHLLGDAAYPLERFLMVPYKDTGFLSEGQQRFNTILSSTRVCVEQAFGILKKKFRILNFIEIRNIKLVKNIIISCMILHNIIINNESFTTSDLPDILEDTSTESRADIEELDGRSKRDQLTNLLSA